MQQQQSSVGVAIFRELTGEEESLVVAHDIEQALIDWLATGEFKAQVLEWLKKTGKFGAGACYPVVYMKGVLQFKVFASVESARSNERMPPPFTLSIEGEAGERKPDTELIAEGESQMSRVTGTSTDNAVDRVRLETNQTPLAPARTAEGGVVNKPSKHAERAEDYQQRFAKSKQTVLNKKAAAETEKQTEAERERSLQEAEARQMEPSSPPESGIK